MFKAEIGNVIPFPEATPADVIQHYMDTCAIKSQQIILTAFGQDVTEDQLVQEAMDMGIYEPGCGTNPEDVGKLLDAHGVHTHTVHNAHVYDLVNELAQGHKVIVGVDSGELWNPSIWEMMEDQMGYCADHALVVTGIDTTDPNNVQVIITDPGSGDVAMRYPMDQFIDAWSDSNCIMIATDDPAPAQFNPEMVNFDYDTGHLDFIGGFTFDFFTSDILTSISDFFSQNGMMGTENADNIFSHVLSIFDSFDMSGDTSFHDMLWSDWTSDSRLDMLDI